MRQVLLLIAFIIPFLSNGQIRTITGKVIDEYLENLPAVSIQNRDTVQLATTDVNGDFKIELPYETNELLFSCIGMEWTLIKLPADCDKLEVIMKFEVIYHYKSHRKIERLRKKSFNKLPEIHSQAASKGLFVNASPCFTRESEPHKQRLDEIRKKTHSGKERD